MYNNSVVFSYLGDNEYDYALNQPNFGSFYTYVFFSKTVLLPHSHLNKTYF